MSLGLVKMLPCLSWMLSSVVFSVFLKITLCILLGWRLRVFLYFEIAFLQFIVVCLIMISRAFFLAVFPMVPSVFIHSLTSKGSFGGFGMSINWWFCRFVRIGWVLQLMSWVIVFMVFLMMWYCDISF
jgi:hypothetical protein